MFSIDGNTIKLTRGDSATFNIEITTEDGKAYELSGKDKIEFTLKNSVIEDRIIIQKQGPTVNITHEDTKNLPFGSYVYDVQITFENGNRDTIIAPEQNMDGTVIPNFILTKEVNWG